MRRKLKQVILALMVSVGMMGAIGLNGAWAAESEKDWRYAGPFEIVDTIANTRTPAGNDAGQIICDKAMVYYNELVGKAIQRKNAHFEGLLQDGLNNGARANCSYDTRLNIRGEWGAWESQTVNIPIYTLRCTEGGFLYTGHLDGCYYVLDKCPQGTVRNPDHIWTCVPGCDEGKVKDPQTGKCVDPCEEARKKGMDEGDDAGRLCDGTICFWSQNIPGWDDMKKQHQDVIRDCTKRHEQIHLNQDREGCYLSECKENGRKGAVDFIHGWYRERDAHQDTETCYRDALFDDACKGDQACMDDVGQRRINSDDEAKKMQGLIDQLPSENRLCE